MFFTAPFPGTTKNGQLEGQPLKGIRCLIVLQSPHLNPTPLLHPLLLWLDLGAQEIAFKITNTEEHLFPRLVTGDYPFYHQPIQGHPANAKRFRRLNVGHVLGGNRLSRTRLPLWAISLLHVF